MPDSKGRSLWKFRVSGPIVDLGNGTHELALELNDPLAEVKFDKAPTIFRLIVRDDKMKPLLELAEAGEYFTLDLRTDEKQ